MASILSPTLQVGQLSWLNLTSSQQTLLRWLAFLLMVVDHANRILWSFQPWLFTVGRLAFPLFAFLIAYNLMIRKVNASQYMRPLLLFGVISQVPAMLALNRDPLPLNIFFTLLVAVSVIPLRRWFSRHLPDDRLWQRLSWLVGIYLMLILSLGVEYGPLGVLLVPSLILFLERPGLQGGVAVIVLLVMVNGLHISSLATLLIIPLIFGVSRLKFTSIPRTKWLFYAFYPGHLIALWLLRATL